MATVKKFLTVHQEGARQVRRELDFYNLAFDYFEELTRRIQDIRASERRFYQKITDIYATSIDYDPTVETTVSTSSRQYKTRCTGHYRLAIVKSICDIMRRSNCASALQEVPELTWILFPRILDDSHTAGGYRHNPSPK